MFSTGGQSLFNNRRLKVVSWACGCGLGMGNIIRLLDRKWARWWIFRKLHSVVDGWLSCDDRWLNKSFQIIDSSWIVSLSFKISLYRRRADLCFGPLISCKRPKSPSPSASNWPEQANSCTVHPGRGTLPAPSPPSKSVDWAKPKLCPTRMQCRWSGASLSANCRQL